MNLENSIKDVITQKLEDGTVERLIAEELEKGIQKSLENLFGHWGDASKVIEEKIKSVMVPYLESYDYSNYIVKLDTVLVEILQNTALDNKKILENFKNLIDYKAVKEIKTSEIFDEWMDYVSKEIDTSELEVEFDDEVHYEYADVKMEVIYQERPSWSNFEKALIVLECDKDEDMNFEIEISNYNGNGWKLAKYPIADITSLRRLDRFSIFLMNLVQSYTTIVIDEDYVEEGVEVEAEPEPSFS